MKFQALHFSKDVEGFRSDQNALILGEACFLSLRFRFLCYQLVIIIAAGSWSYREASWHDTGWHEAGRVTGAQ